MEIEMASPSWFNENENRSYPFVHVQSATVPPDALVVDAGFTAGAKSGFEAGVHVVKLSAVRRRGAYFYFDFTSDAPELYGLPLTFTRTVGDGDFASEFVEGGTAGASESSDSGSDSLSACDEPPWSGFLVTGRTAALEALLPGDGEVSVDATVEPALVQNLAGTFVTRLAVANADRTRVTAAEGCGSDSLADDVTYVNAKCVVGDVAFKPGYNANVKQNTQDNSITLGAAVGDGEGEPCGVVPLFAGEAAAVSSTLYEGGPRCNETLRSVNGIGGPSLTITAGRGVTVTSVPEDNKVVVNVNMSGLALCYDSISERSESC